MSSVFGAYLLSGSVATGFTVGTIITVLATITGIAVKSASNARGQALLQFAKYGYGGQPIKQVVKDFQDHLDKITAGANLVLNTTVDISVSTKDLEDAVANISRLSSYLVGDNKLTKEQA